MKTLRMIVLVGGVCAAQQGPKGVMMRNPFSGDRQAIEAGRAVFRIYCSPCHGIQAGGGRAPDLTRETLTAGDLDLHLFNVISNGVPGTEMPSFSLPFSDEVIWQLVSYIRSVARRDPTPPAGNPQSGEKLFWGKGGCGNCHWVDGRGGRMGPDLSRAGRQRSLAYLREAVVSPNAEITAGYNTITVVTRAGKKIVGVQRGYDNFSAQFVDAAENFYSFRKDDVNSMQREFRSLMPEGYGKMFSTSEIDDLLAYLVSLRGTEAKR